MIPMRNPKNTPPYLEGWSGYKYYYFCYTVPAQELITLCRQNEIKWVLVDSVLFSYFKNLLLHVCDYRWCSRAADTVVDECSFVGGGTQINFFKYNNFLDHLASCYLVITFVIVETEETRWSTCNGQYTGLLMKQSLVCFWARHFTLTVPLHPGVQLVLGEFNAGGSHYLYMD